MKILVVSPLFPPEIGGAAPYAKELVKRLSRIHDVSLIALATHPESIEGVRIIVLSKYTRRLMRIPRLIAMLWHEARKADVLYVLNGASTEFAAGIVSLVCRTPFILARADIHAYTHHPHKIIGKLAVARAATILDSFPPPRPEILPLEPFPQAAFDGYEQSWSAHLALLTSTFNHVAH